MSYSIIGEQIQKFRKEKRLTQKELGEAIGVSSSAVSQWESGGTPDVSLLPAIADRLGVTIDALFGREKVTQENMKEALPRYVASLPESMRIAEICDLMWNAMKSGWFGQAPAYNGTDEYNIYFASDEGVILGASSEKAPFMSVFPEPVCGYEALFNEDAKYCELFSALSKPHAFELLKLLYRRLPKHCTAGVMAKLLNISTEETEALLSAFTSLRLVQRLELEADDGDTDAYIVNDTGALVPFLYSVRTLLNGFGGFHLSWYKRNTPLLITPGHEE